MNFIKKALNSILWRSKFYWEKNFETKSLFYRRNSMLILRIDEIGDYILFRNFLHEIKNSQKYSNYNIYLLGNIIWKEIALNFDSETLKGFIWIDKKKFWVDNEIIYRFFLLLKLRLNGFCIIVYPTFSRDKLGDYIVKHSGAQIKIGNFGDAANQDVNSKYLSDKFYDKLIKISSNKVFEFYKNLDFFEKFLDKTININKPDFNIRQTNSKEFIVLFPGARNKSHKWDYRNFISLINAIHQNLDIKIIICGGYNDLDECRLIQNGSDNCTKIENLAGKTDLIDLIDVISKAYFLISNDTSAIHIAASTSTPFICIANGDHFGRFSSYPKEIFNNSITIYPPEIEISNDNFETLVNKYSTSTNLDINTISFERVWNGTKAFIQQLELNNQVEP